MSRTAYRLEPLRRARWPILVTLAVVPVVAMAVASFRPAEYRSEATVAFSGRNTGYVQRDVEQAHLAVGRDPSLAARTLDTTGVRGMTAPELQDEIQLAVRPGRLEIAVNRESEYEAWVLADEFSFQLARDQRARIASPARGARKVRPQLLETGLFGLALAIPLAMAFATGLEALRRHGPGEP